MELGHEEFQVAEERIAFVPKQAETGTLAAEIIADGNAETVTTRAQVKGRANSGLGHTS